MYVCMYVCMFVCLFFALNCVPERGQAVVRVHGQVALIAVLPKAACRS